MIVAGLTALLHVLIAGDSISMHYADTVRAELGADAHVETLLENGRHAASLPGKIDAMVGPWDTIVVNAGLHDLTRGGDGPTPLARYRADLEQLREHLAESYPSATVLWARTTPVCDGSERRPMGAEMAYNAVADEVWSGYPTIDLHGLTKPHCDQWRKAPGNVHYNHSGRYAQGAAVAAAIRKVTQ